MSRTDVDQHQQDSGPRVGDHTPSTRRRRAGAAALVAAVAAVLAVALAVISADGGDAPAEPDPRPTAEELVAQDFLTAFASSDPQRVAYYLAEDAAMPEGWPRDLKRYEAWRAVFLVQPCETMSTSAAGTNISCAFDHHALGSEELGRGPFGLNVFTLRVDDGKVDQFQEYYNAESNGFMQQFDSIGAWVRANHPGDWDFMESHEDVSDADFPRWLRLWDERITQYVAAMTES